MGALTVLQDLFPPSPLADFDRMTADKDWFRLWKIKIKDFQFLYK